jgi:hypothetical protein
MIYGYARLTKDGKIIAAQVAALTAPEAAKVQGAGGVGGVAPRRVSLSRSIRFIPWWPHYRGDSSSRALEGRERDYGLPPAKERLPPRSGS